MTTLDTLFSPLTIRGVTIPNRVLSTGHQTFLSRHGSVSDELIAYHEARAKGGAGLIILESARFHETAISDLPELLITRDDHIAGYRALASAVHRHGTKVLGQLSHSGRCSQRRIGGARGVVYAPSAVPDDRFHTMPRAMPTAMVEDVIRATGEGAARMAESGLDGVEILVSHGLLFAQFINPATNLREDEFGGAFENRLRPLAASLRNVRAAVGPDRIVGIRISVGERELDGMDEALAQEVCIYLCQHDLVDYINVTVGSMAGPGGSIHVVPPMEIEVGYTVPEARRIRDVTGLPVFVAGRINQPQDAEKILRDGSADMCGMTRALICDEAMPRKARDADFDAIRACIGCNQGCIGHFHKGVSITCIQNPTSGRETTLPAPQLAANPQRVLVVGGGPAGLKAAAVAAEAGHDVTLCEASAQLGGQALLAAALPGRAEFGGLVSNLHAELKRRDVDIRLNTRVDRALVIEHAPDQIILATGSRPYRPDFAGSDEAHVVDAHQVLEGRCNPGGRVLIADWRCDWAGIGIAEKLALDGRHVRLAVNGIQAGIELQQYQRDQLIGKLHHAGVEVIPYARLFGADADTVYLTHTITQGPIVCEEVDTLVLAYGTKADTRLEETIADMEIRFLLAGDCLSPRTAEEAVLEGMRSALAI